MTFKKPENEAEINANRAKFIEALINEDQEAQCFGELFVTEIPGPGKRAVQKRCAVGVAAKLFLGLKTKAAYLKYTANRPNGEPGHAVYEEVADMLGIHDGCTSIWRLNDDENEYGKARTFAGVGTVLRREWNLNG